MAENSKIQWTTHTFNPWSGCTKVSDGCKNCYAESLMDHRYKKTKWGPNGLRVIKADSGWREPIKWNKVAEHAGERHRVFCASLADVFEWKDTMPETAWPDVQAARVRLFSLIDATPNLDWLLLTKRPHRFYEVIGALYDETGWESRGEIDDKHDMLRDWRIQIAPMNVWIGTSIEDSRVLHRVDDLRRVPAAIRFLSCEPLIGALDNLNLGGIDWVIVGGESGSNARPFNVQWARSIVEQCKVAGVACFVKQLGSVPVIAPDVMDAWPDYPNYKHSIMQDGMIRIRLRDSKGGDWNEWPDDLRVREFPRSESERVQTDTAMPGGRRR